MKRLTLVSLLIVAFVLSASLPAVAERGDDAKRVSKNGKAEGVIEGVKVTVEYGRPKVNNRKILGDLVPFDKIWRTGANEATNITFSKDVAIEGKKVPAGTYALFTIPMKDKWKVLINRDAKQWGSMKYAKTQDVAAVDVKPGKGAMIEEMTFKIDGNKVVLLWDTFVVAFRVAATK